MKLLCIADEECKALWDYYTPDKIEGVDLIIACGDLNRHYLEYLTTMAPCRFCTCTAIMTKTMTITRPRAPSAWMTTCSSTTGCALWGWAGPCRYRTGAWQFTEAEMRKRINRLRGKIDRHGGFDILVTHAPMHGYGDLNDLPHRGFTVFHELLDRYHPQLMLHGHIHLTYGCNIPREHRYGATRIVNCYERVALEAEPVLKERTGHRFLGTPAAATLTPFVRRTTHD